MSLLQTGHHPKQFYSKNTVNSSLTIVDEKTNLFKLT